MLKKVGAYHDLTASVTGLLEFFTNSPQYKNANIANFILAVALGID